MSRSVPLLVAAILVSLLAACASPPEFRAGASGRTFPAHGGEVRVLERYPAAGTYDRVGTVIVRGVKYTRDSALREGVLEEAARRGANAVIFQGPIVDAPVSDGSIERKLGAFLLRVHDR